MPLPVIFILAFAFLFVFFTLKAFKQTIVQDQTTQYTSLAPLSKRFETLDGQLVVAFRCNAYIEGNKANAITQLMVPGTIIEDSDGRQYVAGDYLKKYSNRNYVFGEGKGKMYVVFAVAPVV